MNENLRDIFKYFILIILSLSITYYAATSSVNVPVVLGIALFFMLLYIVNKFKLLKKLIDAFRITGRVNSKDKSM